MNDLYLFHLFSLFGFIGWCIPHDVYIQALHVWFCSRIWHKVSLYSPFFCLTDGYMMYDAGYKICVQLRVACEQVFQPMQSYVLRGICNYFAVTH